MIRNPFASKPKTPIDQALDAFDGVRTDAADYAAAIRDAAADIAETLTELGPPAPKGRKLPMIAGVAAAGLGIAYLVRSKVGGSVDDSTRGRKRRRSRRSSSATDSPSRR